MRIDHRTNDGRAAIAVVLAVGGALVGACSEGQADRGSGRGAPSSDCGTTANGATDLRTCYFADAVPAGESCQGWTQARTCVDGIFAPDWPTCSFTSCYVQNGASCGSIQNGGTDTRTCYPSSEVPYGQTCSSTTQTRTCVDGVWSPDFPACSSLSCYTAPASSCGSIANGGTDTRLCYASAFVAARQSCQSTTQSRTCVDGVFAPDFPACANLSCEVLPVPPTTWNGINYFPRHHYAYDMLWDWYATDQTTGQPVYANADADMALLSANGFNFLHLYIWDNGWFADHKGFAAMPADPHTSANNQWAALESFLDTAWRHHLYVGIHFAMSEPPHDLNNNLTISQADALGTEFYTWAEPFLTELPQSHPNIILFGLIFALGPVPDRAPRLRRAAGTRSS